MKELFEGLEQSRKDFNNWQGQAWLNVDFSTGKAWTDVSQHVTYEDDQVFTLVYKGDLYDRNERYEKEQLEAIAQSLINFKKSGKFSDEVLRIDFEDLAADAFYYGVAQDA